MASFTRPVGRVNSHARHDDATVAVPSPPPIGKGVDNELVVEVDDDDQLPLTADRRATWASSAFHNVTAMVGAGVLGLPATFGFLGWYGGMAAMIVSIIVSWYTFWQLVHLHEQAEHIPTFRVSSVAPRAAVRRVTSARAAAAAARAAAEHDADDVADAKAAAKADAVAGVNDSAFGVGAPLRLNRYHELTQYAFGRKKGAWVIVPFQLMVMVGLAITYTVTGGSSLYNIYTRLGGVGVTKTAWIGVFSAVELLLAQIPSFHHLTFISLMGAVCSLGYSAIAAGLSGAHAASNGTAGVSYAPGGKNPPTTPAGTLFGVSSALSTIAFAYGGHNIACEIQAGIPGPATTVPTMMRGVNLAYLATFLCYYSVAITGYAAFGREVSDNVLESLGGPLGAVVAADFMVVFHVLASYQVYSFPVFDMIQQALVKRKVRVTPWGVRAIRVAYVCFTFLVAAAIPFFGSLMGLVGAIGVTPTTFVMPAVLWLVIRRPPARSVHFWASWAIIIGGCIVGVLGTIGSLHDIVASAGSYKFFS